MLQRNLSRAMFSACLDILFFYLNGFLQSKFNRGLEHLEHISVVSFSSLDYQKKESLSSVLTAFQDKILVSSLYDPKSLKVYQQELELFLSSLNKHSDLESLATDHSQNIIKFTNKIKYAFKSSALFKIQKDKQQQEYLALTLDQHKVQIDLESVLRENN